MLSYIDPRSIECANNPVGIRTPDVEMTGVEYQSASNQEYDNEEFADEDNANKDDPDDLSFIGARD